MAKALCVTVPKALGETTIHLVRELELFNRELKIHQDEKSLYIPLTRKPLPQEIKKLTTTIPEFEIQTHEFAIRVQPPSQPVDLLKNDLPPPLLGMVPHAIDFVGDIAILEVPPKLEAYKTLLGEAVLKMHKRVKTVLAKSGAIEGIYRLRRFTVIGGLAKTTTIHKEHGCIFHLDLAKTYFSPRLSNEHHQVAQQVTRGEIVVDMFAGVGPFAIMIARNQKSVTVYAIDVNPDAIAYLKQNIAVNRVEMQVVPILGNVRHVVKDRLIGVADRVIMNLPESANKYVDLACSAIKSEGGIIHYYTFTKAPNPLETANLQFKKAMIQTSRGVKQILSTRLVRATAPFTWQVVVNAEIT